MNDRFKFRVWDKRRNKFIESPEPTPMLQANGLLAYFKDAEYMKNYVIQFCTGLKDKNGKLIYEGDIVKFRNTDNKYYIGTIKYTDDDALFCLSYKNESNRDDWDYVIRYRLEVIGNIYENKELLESEG